MTARCEPYYRFYQTESAGSRATYVALVYQAADGWVQSFDTNEAREAIYAESTSGKVQIPRLAERRVERTSLVVTLFGVATHKLSARTSGCFGSRLAPDAGL